MLVLNRKAGQALIIQTQSGRILIKSFSAARIGVEAPKGDRNPAKLATRQG